MKWSKELPKEPGFYFYSHGMELLLGECYSCPDWYPDFAQFKGLRFKSSSGLEFNVCFEEAAKWAGPIEAPED